MGLDMYWPNRFDPLWVYIQTVIKKKSANKLNYGYFRKIEIIIKGAIFFNIHKLGVYRVFQIPEKNCQRLLDTYLIKKQLEFHIVAWYN